MIGVSVILIVVASVFVGSRWYVVYVFWRAFLLVCDANVDKRTFKFCIIIYDVYEIMIPHAH